MVVVEPKILVVDDEIRMCDSLKALLVRKGFAVKTASCGHEAMVQLNAAPFDLVLLDLSLPDINGFEILDHIILHHLDTLTIIITGHTSQESALEAFRRKAYDFLRKPVNPNVLYHKITSAIADQKTAIRQRRALAALKQSEAKFRILAENINDVIWIVDLKSLCFTYISPSVRRLLGFTANELSGRPLRDVVLPSSWAYVLQLVQKELPKAKAGQDHLLNVELKLKRKRKSPLWVEVSSRFLRDANDQSCSLLGVARDRTERRQHEREKLRREKLQGVVEMAGAVCHELNQPIQSAFGYCDLILMELAPDDPNYQKVASLLHQIDRMGGIIKKLSRITRYETKDYIKGRKIIDIDKSSYKKDREH